MTRLAINNLVWGVSLAVQCCLLALIVWRGLMRVLPVFAVVLAFYPLRGVALYGLFGHVAPAQYAGIYRGLVLVGLLGQFAVAVEVGVRLFAPAMGRLRAWALLAGLCVLASLGVMVEWSLLPGAMPLPPDRLQMFNSALMVLVGVGALVWADAGWVRRVAIGFGVYGAADLVGTAGRSVAAAHRDAGAYAGWAYLVSGVYLGVMVCWVVWLVVSGRRRPA